MFIFKKKKIVVDCFTYMKSVHQLYKIRKAISYFPEDIKSLPRYTDMTVEGNIQTKISTIKGCNGLTELYKVGFIMPMWTDFICQPKSAAAGTSNLGALSREHFFETHPRTQYPNLYENWMHIKLVSPWMFREKTDVRFTWNPASWNLHKHANNFLINPGVLWFKTQATTNINMFINKDSDNFTIAAGTPMIHIVPVSDADIEIKNHLVSYEDWTKVNPIPNDFQASIVNRWGTYLKDLEKSKEMDRKESKCPFGFGRK